MKDRINENYIKQASCAIKINYGKKITTLRLIKNEICQIKDDKDNYDENQEEDEDEGEKKNEVKDNKNKNIEEENEFSSYDIKKLLRNHREFVNFIQNSTFGNKFIIRNLKLVSLLFLIIFLSTGIATYVNNYNLVKDIKENTRILKISNYKESETQFILKNIMNLVIFYKKIGSNNKPSNYEVLMKTKISDSLIRFENLHNSIQLTYLTFEDKKNILNQKFEMVYLDENSQVFFFFFFIN